MKVASANGTSAGSAARASPVGTGSDGTTATASSPAGGSTTVTSPSAHTTKPPCSDAATLSGWPSIAAARSITSSRGSASSYMWSAAISAATIAAPLDPSPASSGMSERTRN